MPPAQFRLRRGDRRQSWGELAGCPDPFGHIQATGLDAAGRKQYRYHDRWELRRAARKYEETREFARSLPRLRRAVTRDLGLTGMPRERALACAVRLLDLGFFRVGGEEYAESNESYGVATILREHVSLRDGEMVFDFPAKSGQRRVQSIRDPASIEATYIQEKIGEGFSAKDFRTWHATVLAAVELAAKPPPTSGSAAERAIRGAVERVAEALGNTPAVCRSSYIAPRVLDRFRDGARIEAHRPRNGKLTSRARARIEREVLELVS